ncbi:hypothetical protein VTN02DRAFT_3164 [Thermoascus thermophilus]
MGPFVAILCRSTFPLGFVGAYRNQQRARRMHIDSFGTNVACFKPLTGPPAALLRLLCGGGKDGELDKLLYPPVNRTLYSGPDVCGRLQFGGCLHARHVQASISFYSSLQIQCLSGIEDSTGRRLQWFYLLNCIRTPCGVNGPLYTHGLLRFPPDDDSWRENTTSLSSWN